MRDWFHDNYEDPAENCPYESAEGGYQYIWGGPHEALEVLSEEFEDLVNFQTIEELADELNCDCWEWSSKPSYDDYDHDYFEAITSNTEFHSTFLKNMESIKTLLEVDAPQGTVSVFNNLLFANAITALETFLGDAFVNTVMAHGDLVRKFVETTKEFKTKTIPVSDIYKKMDLMMTDVKSHLVGQIWHRLPKVKEIYKATLEIEFTPDISKILKAIETRHDIVHRNGKCKDGACVNIEKEDVVVLLKDLEEFVKHLDSQFAKYVEVEF